jgi:hypothetical protein
MKKKSLRSVVLDNDETTGAYRLLICLLSTIHKIPETTLDEFLYFLEQLAEWMEKNHLFRPGLGILLETLYRLREHNRIDAIIMYTNQSESFRKTLPLINSPPQCIAYMLTHLSNKRIFDRILARRSDMVILKRFERILDEFPDAPKDIRQIVFVDDLATPTFITANTIEKEYISPSSWYPIKPYRHILTTSEFMDCIQYCFTEIKISEQQIEICMANYFMSEGEEDQTDYKNDKELIELSEFLIRHF